MDARTEQEVWRDAVGYEGIYQVSNLGRVRSVARTLTRSDGCLVRREEHVLSQNPVGYHGYLCVKLARGGRNRNHRVHRLVARAFVPNSEDKPFVDHIDGDKHNNHADNLRWVTNVENLAYYHEMVRKASHGCKDSGRRVVCDNGKTYRNGAEAARDFGCDGSQIYRVLNGSRRSYKGFTFRYEDAGRLERHAENAVGDAA